MNPPGFIVALTGGIASGKTAVSDHLATLGVPIVDTDKLARELVLPGEPALAAIAEHFGATILQADGRLDRAALRQRIFSDPAAKRWLDGHLHPLIRQKMWAALAQSRAPYAVAVIPLLTETGQTEGFDRIALVDVPENVQLARVMARDGVDAEAAQAALRNQATRAARLSLADDIIANDGDRATLQRAVDALHQSYLRLAHEKTL